MAKKVLKFGGTSVGSIDRIVHAAKIIEKEHQAGNKIIVVVSAMSGKTNELISQSKAIERYLADRFGGSKAVFIGFIIFGIGIYMLYSGPNTGIYFQISLGVLVGTALGATAMSVPVSEVGKHFSNEQRTIATGIVTAAASIGYFLAPLFTK